ncbi:MAG: alkaline phosphatase family protein [Gemmataceae bacterium]|nr:alkaline phosphatase family protein [Gemmataceae bacterium]MDW8242560.1 alkaline phosphatase D family protein [Thermogemmata sp.]
MLCLLERVSANALSVCTLAVIMLGTGGLKAEPPPISRIAFGSCSDQDKPLPIFETIAAARPELMLFLGDTMYADLDRSVEVTPEVIRKKYAQLAEVPSFRKLRAACPRFLGIWDDHDYGINDAGAEWKYKAEAQQALLDFFEVPKDDPRRHRQGVYHAETFGPPGQRLQIILLDTRYHRSPLKKGPLDPKLRLVPYLPNTDPDATILGSDQWRWLEEQLRQPADLRLLVSSIQVLADEHPFEKWANFPRERERLYELLRRTKAEGLIILSGDRHHGEISLDPKVLGYPLYDITASGFNQASKRWRAPEPNSKRVAAVPFGDHFGWITIDWQSPDPQILIQLRDVDGDALAGIKLRRSMLQNVAEAGPAPPGVLTPQEAGKHVGQRVTVQFVVRSVGGKTNIYLNSTENFRSADNFAVVLTPKAQAGPWAKTTAETFMNKIIRATGTVRLNRDSPQLEVTDPHDLQIVEPVRK